MNNLENELSTLLNRYSQENVSNTPDFILANYLLACLSAFDQATQSRDAWYGKEQKPGAMDAKVVKEAQPESKGWDGDCG